MRRSRRASSRNTGMFPPMPSLRPRCRRSAPGAGAGKLRTGLRAAALLAAILASPWLIAGATRLNAALESSLAWTAGLPGAWVLAVLVAAAVLISRVRSR